MSKWSSTVRGRSQAYGLARASPLVSMGPQIGPALRVSSLIGLTHAGCRHIMALCADLLQTKGGEPVVARLVRACPSVT